MYEIGKRHGRQIMNPNTMNREARGHVLWVCLLLCALSAPAQLFRNHFHSFELASGSSLEFPFHSQDAQFDISGGEQGEMEVISLDDTTYVLFYQPDHAWEGEDVIRISGATLQESGSRGQANFYLSIKHSDGLVRAYPDVAATSMGRAIELYPLNNDESHLRSMFIQAIPSVNGGRVDFVPGSTELTFLPEPGFSGRATLTYLACDPSGNCDLGEATIWVDPPQPRTIPPLRLFVRSGEELVLPVPSGATVSTSPSNGKVYRSHQTLRYTPDADFTGVESFSLLREGLPDMEVSITVFPEKKKGFARDDRFYASPGGVVLIDLLKNDLFDGKEIGCVEVDPPSRGVLRPLAAPGRYAYAAPGGFTGVETFSYRVMGPDCQGDGDAAQASLHIGHFEPMYDRYQFEASAGVPLLIRNQVPVSNFVWRILEAPRYGKAEFFKEDTFLHVSQAPLRNGLLYTPSASISGMQDRMVLEYCVGESAGCSFTKSVEILIDLQERRRGAFNYCLLDCIWPGDANRDGEVALGDLLTIGQYMGRSGEERAPSDPDYWMGEEASLWDHSAVAHADLNGDGLISAADTATLSIHLGKTNSIVSYVPVETEATIDLVYAGGPVSAGEEIEIEVYLGSREAPVQDLVGFSFPLYFNPAMIQGSSIELDFETGGWLGHFSPLLSLSQLRQGVFETAITRTNGEPVIGYGKIGHFRVIVTEDINGIRPGKITLGGGVAHLSYPTGDSRPVRVSTLEIPFQPGASTVTSTQSQPLANEELQVFPNPTHATLHWRWEGRESLLAVELLDLSGKRVRQPMQPQGAQASLDVQDLPNGMYVLQVRTENRILHRKVQVMH